VGACKDLIIPRNADQTLAQPTSLVDDAHDAGLVVHGWTFRVENRFLPLDFRSSANLEAPGNLLGEIRAFLRTGMDGFFTDNPDVGTAAAS